MRDGGGWLLERLRRLAQLHRDIAEAEERLRGHEEVVAAGLDGNVADHRRHARELEEAIGRAGGEAPDRADLRGRILAGASALEARVGLGLHALRGLELAAGEAYVDLLERPLSPHLPESSAINLALGREEGAPGPHVAREIWELLLRQQAREQRHLERVTAALAGR